MASRIPADKKLCPFGDWGDRRSKLLGELVWMSDRLAAVPDLTLAEVRSDLVARGVLVCSGQ
ncbi:MAG: hypothetical protein ABI668_09145 [Sphingorhabdus sp.]